MELVSLALMCLSLAQAPAAQPPRDDPPTAGPLVDVRPGRPERVRLDPPELLKQMLAAPPSIRLEGQALRLAEVLARSSVRSRQIELAHAYWKLTTAIGQFHVSLDEHGQLASLEKIAADAGSAGAADARVLGMEAHAAAARREEARLQAVAAQAELADLLQLPSGAPLPLPYDLPHVGGYQTHFERLFAGRVPPSRLRLVDRALPLRREAIEARAAAIRAALDALEAAFAGVNQRAATPRDVARHVVSLAEQQRAFLNAVQSYNDDIADYALTLASPSATATELLAMLIKPAAEPKPAPAAGQQPPTAGNGSREGLAPSGSREGSTTPQGSAPSGSNRDRSQPGGDSSSGSSDSRDSPTSAALRSVLARRDPLPAGTAQGAQDRLFAPEPSEPQTSTDADADLYGNLSKLSPARRTSRLAALLNADRSSAIGDATPISLEECLAAVSPQQRAAVIRSYWAACRRRAKQQVTNDRFDQLNLLSPGLLEARGQPGGPDAMVRFRAAQAAAEADLADARLDVLRSQFELSLAVGRADHPTWLRPGTVPHGGRYELKLQQQPPHIAQSRQVRRLADAIPALHAALQNEADAVLLADAYRAELTAGPETISRLGEVLQAIDFQAELSNALLDTLTDYNLAIGQYALAVLPAGTPPSQVSAALVVQSR
jgi:hypothetical protein